MDGEVRRQRVEALKERLLAQESALLRSMTARNRDLAPDTYQELTNSLRCCRRLQEYAVSLEMALKESGGSVDSREVQDIRQHLDDYMEVLWPEKWKEEKQRRGRA